MRRSGCRMARLPIKPKSPLTLPDPCLEESTKIYLLSQFSSLPALGFHCVGYGVFLAVSSPLYTTSEDRDNGVQLTALA